jgi:uncharacterized protein (DUF58 family)
MALTGLLGWLNLRGLEVDIRVPDEIYSGIETLVTFRITNRKRRLPSFLLCAGFLDSSTVVMMADRQTTSTRSIACTFPRRGAYPSLEALISSPFPVNFFVRRLRCSFDTGVTVFPAPIASRAVSADAGRQREGELLRSAHGHDGDLAWIGDYTGREPLKSVHWRLSARHDDLKVKGFNATGAEPVVIDLHALPARTPDEAVGRAAFLVNDLMRRNRPVGLRIGSLLVKPGLSRSHRLMLLQELATHAAD